MSTSAILALFVGVWLAWPRSTFRDRSRISRDDSSGEQRSPELAGHATVSTPSPGGGPDLLEDPDSRDAPSVVRISCAPAPHMEKDVVTFVSEISDESPPRTLRVSAEDGTADITIPPAWFEMAGRIELLAGVAGGGIMKRVQPCSLDRGTVVNVSINLDTGLAVSGLVTDPDGSPVPGITVVARRARGAGSVKSSAWYDSDDLLYSAADFEEGRATTDVAGRFRLSGLGSRTYCLTTSDLGWAFVPGLRPGVRPPRDDLAITAVRTHQIHVLVRNAATRELVPKARVTVSLYTDEGDVETGFTCPNGEANVALLPRGTRMKQALGLVIPAQVQALGYEPTATTLEFGPGDHSIRKEIDLVPVPTGTVLFLVHRADGGLASGKFTATFTGDTESHVLALVAGEGEGRFHCEMPVGRWQCRVYPDGAISQMVLSWEGEVTVSRGAPRVPVSVSLPAYGEVQVSGAEKTSVGLRFEVAGQGIRTVASHSRHIYLLPEGEWPYMVSLQDGSRQSGSVVVREAQRSTLTIEQD